MPGAALASFFQRVWRTRGLIAALLVPLSAIYGAAAALHRRRFRADPSKVTRLPVPVVVVGNVVAGGAGKTPVVIALVEHLKAAGKRPGVVARGYGRSAASIAAHDVAEVTAVSDVRATGDEPLLIARRTGVPVFVARRRGDAGRALLASHPEVDVIVSDDGLQHHALARDIEICVFDGRGTGNGWLLPAGPLREPWPRAVDFILRSSDTAITLPGAYTAHRRLGAEAIDGSGGRCAVTDLARLSRAPGARVAAMAGIASPDMFFDQLQSAGLVLAKRIPLPDHYHFDSIRSPFYLGHLLICTEKDAVKLWRHRPDAWAVPLEMTIDSAFWKAFDDRLGAVAAG